MRAEDFPGLYRAADTAAVAAQSELLHWNKANSSLLVAASALALVGSLDRKLAIVGAVLFIASLGLIIYLEVRAPQRRWYQARALAESIKTATWRLMMSADPFQFANPQANLSAFQRLLGELLQQNRSLGGDLASDVAQDEQVTVAIRRICASDFETKRSLYLTERVANQQAWYSKRATENKRASSRLFRTVVLIYSIAIFLLFVRVAQPNMSYLPVEVLAVAASSLLAWKHIRRFDELASAYALTAYEVGIIRGELDDVHDVAALARFVSDSENAFSREHTQWAARRDH